MSPIPIWRHAVPVRTLLALLALVFISGSPVHGLAASEACELAHTDADRAYPHLVALSEPGNGTRGESWQAPEECVFLERGLIERARGELSAAETTFRTGLTHHRSVHLRMEMAMVQAFQERYDTSLANYRDVLREYPDLLPARMGLARVLAWNKQRYEALEHYQQLKREYPDDPAVLNGLGFVYRAQLRYELARRHYRRVLELDPENAEALEGLEAIREAPRNELSASFGEQTTNGAEEVSLQAFNFRRLIGGKGTSLSMAYREDSIEFVDTVALGFSPQDAAREMYRSSISWHHSERGVIEIDGEVRQLEVTNDYDKFLGLNYYRFLNDKWILQGGVRAGDLVLEGRQYLAHAGFVHIYRPRHEIVAQVFHNNDLQGDEGFALAARWEGIFDETYRLRLGGAHGDDRNGTFTSYFAEVGYRRRELWEVFVQAQRYEGSFEREALRLGLIYRFN